MAIPIQKQTALRHRESDLFSPLHRELNRFMEDFFSSFPVNLDSNLSPTNFPALNLSESEKAYQITAEMPGIQGKDIELFFSGGKLHIRGEKEVSKEEKENGFLKKERSYGSFYRSVSLSAEIEEDKIQANLKDGILTVNVPKAPSAMKSTKKIPVQKL